MPTFSKSGADEYTCQKCARRLDSEKYPPEWRPDITGNSSAANVCPECLNWHSRPEPLAKRHGHELYRLQGGVIIHRFQIIGTTQWVAGAWEPIEGPGATRHNTITTFTECGVMGWFGRIGSLTFTEEEYRRAYGLIRKVFPGLFVRGKEEMGEIVTYDNQEEVRQ